jgi:hypothetical protein
MLCCTGRLQHTFSFYPMPRYAPGYALNYCSTKISARGSPLPHGFVCWIPWRYVYFYAISRSMKNIVAWIYDVSWTGRYRRVLCRRLRDKYKNWENSCRQYCFLFMLLENIAISSAEQRNASLRFGNMLLELLYYLTEQFWSQKLLRKNNLTLRAWFQSPAAVYLGSALFCGVKHR